MRAGLVLSAAACAAAKGLAPTPPMGWMNWEIFRCQVDCAAHPDACVDENLFRNQTDRLAADGYLAAGYDTIHLDDCWMRRDPPRNAQGELEPEPTRFPSGMKALGDYMHAKGVKFGLYTAESPKTCAGYPASADHEKTDAATFAGWGVDYMKVDGCGAVSYYAKGYPAMGEALVNSGRDIVYSCSWPAYIGSNETTKPFSTFIASHCNLWRNWDDIQCNWNSLASIIEHWGQYGEVLAKWAGPNHWNDPDMLLIGNTCITEDEARAQMAIWSVVAAPLIMGNDLRTVPEAHKAILLNREAIAVDQDPLGKQGQRVAVDAHGGQVWLRQLASGRAVALYNPTGAALAITVDFSSIGVTGAAAVRDVFAQKDLGSFSGSFTATIASHGAGLYRLA